MNFEPRLQIRSNTLIRYNQYPRNPLKTNKKGESVWNFYNVDEDTGEITRKTTSGLLTAGVKKRLTRAIELMVQAHKESYKLIPETGRYHRGKLTFCTLTFAENDGSIIPANEAHNRCLEPFLQWMRRRWGCTMYVWKAELQKRGQLHYHIISDAYIPMWAVHTKWNQLQKAAGWLESYHAKFGNYNPPGTEIESVHKKYDIAGYLRKEMLKAYQNANTVGGKVWDCSKNLKENDLFTTGMDGGTVERIERGIQKGTIKVQFSDTHCIIFKMTNKKPAATVLSTTDRRLYDGLMYDIRCRPMNKAPVLQTLTDFEANIGVFSSS